MTLPETKQAAPTISDSRGYRESCIADTAKIAVASCTAMRFGRRNHARACNDTHSSTDGPYMSLLVVPVIEHVRDFIGNREAINQSVDTQTGPS